MIMVMMMIMMMVVRARRIKAEENEERGGDSESGGGGLTIMYLSAGLGFGRRSRLVSSQMNPPLSEYVKLETPRPSPAAGRIFASPPSTVVRCAWTLAVFIDFSLRRSCFGGTLATGWGGLIN